VRVDNDEDASMQPLKRGCRCNLSHQGRGAGVVLPEPGTRRGQRHTLFLPELSTHEVGDAAEASVEEVSMKKMLLKPMKTRRCA
jgi:hypothetical protein